MFNHIYLLYVMCFFLMANWFSTLSFDDAEHFFTAHSRKNRTACIMPKDLHASKANTCSKNRIKIEGKIYQNIRYRQTTL